MKKEKANKKKKINLNKKQKIILVAVIAIVAIMLVVGGYFIFFNKDSGVVKKENKKVEEVKKVQIVDMESDTRPVAVMINNIGVARKHHVGLQDAYMVYEVIVEGGLTRLMALYKDAETAKIGSVRSARHYYLDYALENDAVYVHWGYSEFAQSDISKLGVNNVNGLIYGNKYFWRDKSLGISSEHTAYTSMELINKGIDKLGYRKTTEDKPLLSYSADEIDLSKIDGVVPANNVTVKYSTSVKSEYVYDSEAKNYKRSVNGTAHTDYESKEQYTAKNIITYQVKNTTIAGDYKGRQDLSTVGSGEGYYISNGYAVPIKWEKTSRTARTKYTLLNGEELKVNDGNTYIQIQPVGQTLTIS